MHRLTRYGSTVALGAALAFAGACGKTQDTASTDSARADSAAAATNTAGTPTADSTAMGTAPGGAMTAPNALAMIGLSNAGEIETSRIAEEKATNKDVHAFAHMMVQDHQ